MSRSIFMNHNLFGNFLQIPDKVLEDHPRERITERDNGELSSSSSSSPQSRPSDDDNESGNYIIHDADTGDKGQGKNETCAK